MHDSKLSLGLRSQIVMGQQLMTTQHKRRTISSMEYLQLVGMLGLFGTMGLVARAVIAETSHFY